MPGSALVIDETLETRRWIDVQGQVAVGDGVIAYETQSDGQLVLRIEDAATGEALHDTGPINKAIVSQGQTFAFAGDGETLVQLHDGQPWIVPFRSVGASNPPLGQVDTGSRQPIAVHATGVPGRVLVEWDSAENIGGPNDAGARAVSILDVATGELVDVDGLLPIDPELPGQFGTARYFVTIAAAPDTDSRAIARLTDIATGETMLTSGPIDAAVRVLVQSNNVFGSSDAGNVATISPPDGTPVLLDAITGTVTPVSMDMLPTTSDKGDLAWHIAPSSDGALLFAIGLPQADESDGVDIRPPSDPMEMGGFRFAIAPVAVDLRWSDPVDLLPAGVILGVPASDASVDLAVLEAETTASPVAEAATCDLTADIPVVTGTDLDLPGTMLRLVDGTLTLECEDTSRIVAEGVAEVVPGSTWPGAVLLHMDDGSLRGINLLTGAEGDLGAYSDQAQGAYARVTRWIFFPTTPEQIDWRIIDLETMDSLLLSDELGGVLPHSTVAHLWATTPDATVIGFGGIPILPAGTGSFDLGATPAAGTPVAELPAEWPALVFDGSLDNRHWTTASLPMWTTAAISPDGALLAVSEMTDDGFTVRVERLADGELVAETGIELDSADGFLVLDDGLLHLTPDRLDRVTWDDGEVTVDTLIAFDAPAGVPVLVQTTEPGTVVVGGSTPSGDSVGYLVEVASGEVTEVPGMLQTPFYSGQFNDGVPVGYVLAVAPNPDASASTVQMVDASTGQPVVISEPIDVAPQELAKGPAALRGDRGVVFLADGRTVLLDATTGDASVIEPPDEGGGWTFLSPSPAGDALVVARPSGDAWIRYLAPGAEWVKITPRDFVTLVPGAAATP
jgi:hypothetical protein